MNFFQKRPVCPDSSIPYSFFNFFLYLIQIFGELVVEFGCKFKSTYFSSYQTLKGQVVKIKAKMLWTWFVNNPKLIYKAHTIHNVNFSFLVRYLLCCETQEHFVLSMAQCKWQTQLQLRPPPRPSRTHHKNPEVLMFS